MFRFMTALLVLAVVVPATASPGATIFTTVDDAQVSTAVDAAGTSGQVGFSGTDARNVVYVFPLPSALLAGGAQDNEKFDTATFSARLNGVDGTLTFNADLYGLDYRTTPTVLLADRYAGSGDVNATLIQDNFVTPSAGSGRKFTDSDGDEALVSYLNGQLTAARQAGATSAYVFLRLSPDIVGNNFLRYKFDMREVNTNNFYWAKIDYTTMPIPEPGFAGALGLMACAGLMARRRVG